MDGWMDDCNKTWFKGRTKTVITLTFFLPRFRTIKTNGKKNDKHQKFDISMTRAENVCLPVSKNKKKTSTFRTGKLLRVNPIKLG